MRKSMVIICLVVIACTLQHFTVGVVGQNCGYQGGGGICSNGECCSPYGWCGITPAHCGTGCQSQCTGTPPLPPSGAGAGSVLTRQIFNALFPNHISFYTYDAFITAAAAYPTFLTQGSDDNKKRELAAFAAHVSLETSGLVKIEEDGAKGNPQSNYCLPSYIYPCASGMQYYGRGPLQLSWNYNYKRATTSVGVDIFNYPDSVAQDAVLAFKTALWFWTTALDNKPACHDVMTGQWIPSMSDVAAGRFTAGFGITIDIINGGEECGTNPNHPEWAQSRMNYYLNFCNQLNVSPGPSGNQGCASMQPFGVHLTSHSNVTHESSAKH